MDLKKKQTKNCYKRQERTLHKDQEIDPRRFQNRKHISSQQRSIPISQFNCSVMSDSIVTIIKEKFKTTLLSVDRSSRQKISKERQALSDTLHQVNLMDIYRSSHTKARE